MEEQIKRFLNVSYGYGSGSGSGYGSGDGYGYGDGYGSGSGYGYGYSSGSGYGSGYGDGYGYGYGSGDGYGYGYGYGSGSGSGYGCGDGSGDGYGSGDGLKMINGDNIYMIDDIPTIIKQVRGDIAKGFILQSDLTLVPTVVVKQGNKFAHGETLRESYASLMEKLYDDSTEGERIEAFKQHFPDFSDKVSAKELFHWHHILTGSCKQGRMSFCQNKGIDIENDFYDIYEFIKLTKDSYGGEIIKRLVD